MPPRTLILAIGIAALVAACRMRAEDPGVTATSPPASSEAAGNGSIDSSVNRDAQETMSRSELERELDRLERELAPDVRPSGGRHATRPGGE